VGVVPIWEISEAKGAAPFWNARVANDALVGRSWLALVAA